MLHKTAIPFEASTMLSVSDVRDLHRSGARLAHYDDTRNGREWIYTNVAKAGDVDLSVCSNACFLLDVVSARNPGIWSLKNKRPPYFIPATCLRLAHKMDDGYLYLTKLYRDVAFDVLAADYNRMESEVIEAIGCASYYVHSPHNVIDDNRKLISAFPEVVSDYAHGFVRKWLISGSTCSMLTELTGSIALAALACAATAVTSVPVSDQITRLIDNGFDGHYDTEECLKCAREEIRLSAESAAVCTPPPLKRRRVDVSNHRRDDYADITPATNLSKTLADVEWDPRTPFNQ